MIIDIILFSVHAISTQLNPIQAKSGGIESIDWYGYGNRSLESQRSLESHAAGQHTDQNNININTGKPSSTPFKLTNFQSPTGLKILLLTSPRQPQLEYILKRIYELYADFVMKNPFHTPEMPVRSEKFDFNLAKLVRQMSTSNYF